MASTQQLKKRAREERQQKLEEAARAARARTLRLRVLGTLAAAIAALAIVFAVSSAGPGGAQQQGKSGSGGGVGRKFPYAVGEPGPGAPAPAMRLPATDGSTFDLSKQRGKTVMLYFQEGVGCQPCWDQITDLERQPQQLRSLGIDQVVSITTNDLENLQQKARDEGIKTQVLADADLAVSEAYAANQYRMMGTSADGHSFIVVGPDGTIRHRADYGGTPNYTMYVPVDTLLADIRAGLRESTGA